jgi:hypothetical protein
MTKKEERGNERKRGIQRKGGMTKRKRGEMNEREKKCIKERRIKR